MTVQPLTDLPRYLPEGGRIRLGDKGDRGQPRALKTFRFTSGDREAIDQIAATYGGTVEAWEPSSNRSEWQVTTDVDAVPVVLAPNPLGGTPIYELWSGGGIQRRCDGVTAQVPSATPDGSEMIDAPCVCQANGEFACLPITRLTVILEGIRFAGGWRLEARGWHAAEELPAMVELVEYAQVHGALTHAILAIDRRTKRVANKTRHFIVPVLRMDATINDLAAGRATLKGLASVVDQQIGLELEAGTESPAGTSEDDVADAEIVEDTPPIPLEDRAAIIGKQRRVAIDCRKAGLTDEDRHAFARRVSEGRTESSRELTLDEVNRVLDALAKILSGKAVYGGINDEGHAVILKPSQSGDSQ